MESLREIYGDLYLKFALNVDDLSVSADTLTDGQQQAVSLLEGIAQRSLDEDDHLFRLNVEARVGRYAEQFGTTVCLVMRQLSGGGIPEIDTDDILLGQLLTLGGQIWPVFLLPQSDDWPPYFGSLAQHTFNHPASALTWQSILDDPALRALFPGAPDQVSKDRTILGIHSMVTVSIGRGGSLQLAMLPDIMLTAARYRQLLRGGEDLDSYMREVENVLDESRRLARGEEIQVPHLVGLSNMRLPPDGKISTPFGTIRPSRDSDQPLISMPAKTGPYVEAVFETSHPLRILDIRQIQDESRSKSTRRWEGFQSKFDDCRDRAELKITMVRLSLLLASDGNTLIAPAVAARSIFDPLSVSLIQNWQTQQVQPSGASSPDPAALQGATDWANRIRQEDVKKLAIGVKRLLSAASDRADLLDGLIDAVVCWENMFGSNTESVFRICGAMACLLEPDNRDARTGLMANLREIYSLRSKVVHGVRELRPREAKQHRDAAIQHGLEALRRLLTNPSLMQIKDSAVRGERVLLSAGYISG